MRTRFRVENLLEHFEHQGELLIVKRMKLVLSGGRFSKFFLMYMLHEKTRQNCEKNVKIYGTPIISKIDTIVYH